MSFSRVFVEEKEFLKNFNYMFHINFLQEKRVTLILITDNFLNSKGHTFLANFLRFCMLDECV